MASKIVLGRTMLMRHIWFPLIYCNLKRHKYSLPCALCLTNTDDWLWNGTPVYSASFARKQSCPVPVHNSEQREVKFLVGVLLRRRTRCLHSLHLLYYLANSRSLQGELIESTRGILKQVENTEPNIQTKKSISLSLFNNLSQVQYLIFLVGIGFGLNRTFFGF
jgi:hypothetical protein